MEVLDDRVGERDVRAGVEHLLGGEVVGDHVDRQVAHDLGGGRDLDDVAEHPVDVGVGPGHLAPARLDAERPRLLAQVGVLAAGHLVLVDLGRARAHVALEARVGRAHGLPVGRDARQRLARRGRCRAACRAGPRRSPPRFGCEVSPLMGSIARSTASTPASAAASTDAAAIPLVSCVWKWTGIPISSRSADTSMRAASGLQRPAMSLMPSTWAPAASSSLRHPHVVGEVVLRARRVGEVARVADARLEQRPRLEHRVHRDAHVLDPVEAVEDPEEVDAALGRLGHEVPHDVVGVVGVADRVRGAQQHLDQDVRRRGAQLGEPVPRVLAQEPHRHVEGRAAPGLQGEEPGEVARVVGGRAPPGRACGSGWPAATGGRRGRWCR